MFTAQNQNNIFDILHPTESTSRAFSQHFQSLGRIIEHENTLQVVRHDGISEPLFIQNQYAFVCQNKMLKITEIRIENRVIRVIDSFTSKPVSQDSKETVAEPKQKQGKQYVPYQKLLKRKYNWTTSPKEFKIRDTKNLVKNIFKLFQGWVEHLSPRRVDLEEVLKDFLHHNKRFNNSLIISLAKVAELRRAFVVFSESAGEEWINNSRILDKASHCEALYQYLKICKRDQQKQNFDQPVKKELEQSVKIEDNN